MEDVEKSIVVDAPVAPVYEQWTRIEEFPRFMQALKEVRRTGENQFLWRGEIHGQEFESATEVALQIPEHRLAWRSLSGPDSSGVVCFEPHAENQTLVTLKMKYLPDSGWQEPGELARRLEESLRRFKILMEEECHAPPPRL